MIISLFELPNTYSSINGLYASDELDTSIPFFGYNGIRDEIEWYGRSIPLDIFVSDKIRKFKVIEQDTQYIYERIFLSDDEINLRNLDWKSSKQNIYPLQTKVYKASSPLEYNRTFKYVNGIHRFFSDYMPMYVNAHSVFAPTESLAYVIPSIDCSNLNNPLASTIVPMPLLDKWVNLNKLSNVTADIGSISSSLYMEDLLPLVVKPFNMTDELCNLNPIGRKGAIYHLVSLLNDLPISNIKITANAYHDTVEVEFSSCFAGFGNYKRFANYQNVEDDIKKVFHDVTLSIQEDPWVYITIEKLWTEEIYITESMVCPGRSSSIETHSYIDLPVFILGTVGLK